MQSLTGKIQSAEVGRPCVWMQAGVVRKKSCRISYDCTECHFDRVLGHAAEAVKFFNEKWGGIYYDGIFWQALSAYREGELGQALDLSETLKSEKPNYPGLNRLLERLSQSNRPEVLR